MTRMCRVEAVVLVDRKPLKRRIWPVHDIMKTSTTRAWLRREFNRTLKDFAASGWGDKIITAEWKANYGPPCNSIVSGRLSGLRGKLMSESGVFDP